MVFACGFVFGLVTVFFRGSGLFFFFFFFGFPVGFGWVGSCRLSRFLLVLALAFLHFLLH